MLVLLISLALSPPPPADAAAAVRGLTARSFRTREAAQRKLAGMGERARGALRRGTRHADPEVRRRCRELLAGLDGAILATFQPLPMIDALWWDEANHRYVEHYDAGPEAARLRLWEGYLLARGRDHPPWDNYCLATGDLVADWMAAGVPPSWIRAVLAEMRRRDQLFLDYHHGGRWPGKNKVSLPPAPRGVVLPGWMPPAVD